MKQENKIAIAIESFWDGGAEIFAIRLANKLAESMTVHFIEVYPERCNGIKEQMQLLSKKIKIVQLPVVKPTVFLEKILIKFKLMKRKYKKDIAIEYLKKNNIPIVHSHSWSSDEFFANLKTIYYFKLVSSFHGHYEFLENQIFDFRGKTTAFIKNIDAIVYLSPKHIETLDKFGYPRNKREKIFYFYEYSYCKNSVNFKSGDTLKLCIASRAIKDKGWEETIKAVEYLINKKYDITLDLAGDGDFLQYLEDNYKHYNWLTFHGYKSDIMPILRESHIGLLPSTYIAESLPNSIIEYLANAKPVIATNVGAIPEMLDANGETSGIIIGQIINENDYMKIADAILYYLNNPDIIQKHSELSLKAFEKFMPENVLEKYFNLYNSVLNRDKIY